MEYNGNYFEYLAQELRRLPSTGQKYAGNSLRGFEWIGLAVLVRALNRLSQGDRGSEELLSYGLHVRARKKVIEG